MFDATSRNPSEPLLLPLHEIFVYPFPLPIILLDLPTITGTHFYTVMKKVIVKAKCFLKNIITTLEDTCDKIFKDATHDCCQSLYYMFETKIGRNFQVLWFGYFYSRNKYLDRSFTKFLSSDGQEDKTEELSTLSV